MCQLSFFLIYEKSEQVSKYMLSLITHQPQTPVLLRYHDGSRDTVEGDDKDLRTGPDKEGLIFGPLNLP